MIGDYRKLREKQLEFLGYWDQSFIIPTRKEIGHYNFSISFKEIYALRIDDIVSFANKNKMTFEYDYTFERLKFRDIKEMKNNGFMDT